MTVDWLFAKYLLTPGEDPIVDGRVGLNRVTGKIEEVEKQAPTSKTVGTTFITPGLINAHTHLELYAESPIPVNPGESMADWILKVVAFNQPRSDAEKLQACYRSIVDMLQTGITCVNDITSTGTSLEALSQVGLRGIVSPEFFYPLHHAHPNVDSIVTLFQALQQRFDLHPLLQVGISPHSPYNVTPQACQAVLDRIQPALVHTHLAESQEELLWLQKGHSLLDRIHQKLLGQVLGPVTIGKTPTQYWESVYDHRWVAAHGTYLSPQDFKILQQKGVGLVHCPQSNLWLTQETIRDWNILKESHLMVGLGTDSPLSNPHIDLRQEARLAQARHGLHSREVFQMMTAQNAKIMGLEDLCGHIRSGYAADLVLWWSPHTLGPDDDPFDHWLLPDTQVQQVMVQGRTVFELMPCH